MPLSPGEQLGHYKILSMIGKGGMGEVYLGTDTRLGRSVAIKVSSREFNDRFEREAQAISTLNHPNICTLYDVGPNYLVMELVEGELLSKIIDRGPLPLDKALAYAVQIVDALAAAHAKGVIHRDLKPGNIIITRNGVKVLDFGLAKLSSERVSSESAANIQTVTEPITRAGAILGTLYYMAPEQVEGKEADERSDIFSFGVLFHEMVTGQRPFTGDTQAAVLAALLKDQPPPMSQRQPATPRAMERVVRKCLEKKPDDRWQSARDLKPTLELIDLDAPPVNSASTTVPIAVPPPARKSWRWPAFAAALLAAAGLAWTFWPAPQRSDRVTRFEVALPPEVQVNPNTFFARISPDGTKLAFTSAGGKAGIWIRDLESVESRWLPGTEAANAPFWSPDSKSLAYAAGNRLMRVEISGGPPQVLAQSTTPVGSGVWSKNNEILFGGFGRGPLQKVSAAGGVPAPVTKLTEGEAFHSLPSMLPDGRRFIYLRSVGAGSRIFVGSLDNKPDEQSLQQVGPGQFGATFAQASNDAGGVLFFVRDGSLMAQPFDPKALKFAGEPVPVVQQIGTGRAHAHFSVTPSGVMAYRVGSGPNVQLSWLDRTGSTIQKIGDPAKIVSVSLSPDESQVAIFRSASNTPNNGDIWILDLARNVDARLTTGETVSVNTNSGPTWSPDGKQIAYVAGAQIYVKDTGGAIEARALTKGSGDAANISDWTRDGQFVIYTRSGGEIRALPVKGGDPIQIVSEASNGRVSPDGHWIAYQSLRSGRNEVYVRPFTTPGTGPAPTGPVIQISADGGRVPKWRVDGKMLFFMSETLANTVLLSAEIDASGGGFRPGKPMMTSVRVGDAGWSPNKAGDRFLAAPPLDQGAQTPITVVTNWEATLKR